MCNKTVKGSKYDLSFSEWQGFLLGVRSNKGPKKRDGGGSNYVLKNPL
jgi:hypothetical protein